MRTFAHFPTAPAAVFAALLMMASASPATAQYIGGNAPPTPTAPVGAESASSALARNVRILAAEPRNFMALMGAGRAALALDDLSAAAGFFGRADELRPNDPAPKIGMGAALVHTGDARGALAWFARAQALGGSAVTMGADRGLAHDLLGELVAAQADYRAALPSLEADEARRRLALSLAIGGDQKQAIAVLQPLLNRRDLGAQRARAFVLALGGQTSAAAQAIDVAMPGSSGRILPFFTALPRLSTVQKAAAVHLGVFPRPDEIRLAAAVPIQTTPQTAVSTAKVTPPAAKPKKRVRPARDEDGEEVVRGRFFATPAPAPTPTPIPTQSPTLAPPTTVLPSPQATTPPAATTFAPVETVAIPAAPAPVYEQPAPEPAAIAEAAPAVVKPTDRLSGIDKLLAQTTPPAKLANPAKPDRKAAAAKKLADVKKADDVKKALADKKAKDETARIGVAGSHWVQLAGGSNQGNLGREFARIRAKKSTLFAGHGGYVTNGKDYFRLLTGPFDSSNEARAFAAKLAKAGIDGFSWTRTPATLKIEKISPK